jgi:hypothetical protein
LHRLSVHVLQLWCLEGRINAKNQAYIT